MNALIDLVRAFIDGAGQVPLLVWIAILGFGVAVWLAYEVATAPLITDEQRDEIARRHRELRGTRGMPSTRNSALGRRAIGEIAPSTRPTAADGLGPVWRVRPRRDETPPRQT